MIRGKIWRQLEEERTKFSGGSGWFERGDKLGDGRVAFPQTLEVGDPLRRLEAKAEARGCRIQPALQLSRRRAAFGRCS